MHETGSGVREAWRPNLQQRAIPPPWSEWESALFSNPQASRAMGSRSSGGLSGWAQVPQTRRGARSIAWNGGGVCSLRSVKMFPAPMGAGMPLACTVSLGGRRRHWPLSLRPASSARGSRGVAMTLKTGRGVWEGRGGWGGVLGHGLAT